MRLRQPYQVARWDSGLRHCSVAVPLPDGQVLALSVGRSSEGVLFDHAAIPFIAGHLRAVGPRGLRHGGCLAVLVGSFAPPELAPLLLEAASDGARSPWIRQAIATAGSSVSDWLGGVASGAVPGFDDEQRLAAAAALRGNTAAMQMVRRFEAAPPGRTASGLAEMLGALGYSDAAPAILAKYLGQIRIRSVELGFRDVERYRNALLAFGPGVLDRLAEDVRFRDDPLARIALESLRAQALSRDLGWPEYASDLSGLPMPLLRELALHGNDRAALRLASHQSEPLVFEALAHYLSSRWSGTINGASSAPARAVAFELARTHGGRLGRFFEEETGARGAPAPELGLLDAAFVLRATSPGELSSRLRKLSGWSGSLSLDPAAQGLLDEGPEGWAAAAAQDDHPRQGFAALLLLALGDDRGAPTAFTRALAARGREHEVFVEALVGLGQPELFELARRERLAAEPRRQLLSESIRARIDDPDLVRGLLGPMADGPVATGCLPHGSRTAGPFPETPQKNLPVLAAALAFQAGPPGELVALQQLADSSSTAYFWVVEGEASRLLADRDFGQCTLDLLRRFGARWDERARRALAGVRPGQAPSWDAVDRLAMLEASPRVLERGGRGRLVRGVEQVLSAPRESPGRAGPERRQELYSLVCLASRTGDRHLARVVLAKLPGIGRNGDRAVRSCFNHLLLGLPLEEVIESAAAPGLVSLIGWCSDDFDPDAWLDALARLARRRDPKLRRLVNEWVNEVILLGPCSQGHRRLEDSPEARGRCTRAAAIIAPSLSDVEPALRMAACRASYVLLENCPGWRDQRAASAFTQRTLEACQIAGRGSGLPGGYLRRLERIKAPMDLQRLHAFFKEHGRSSVAVAESLAQLPFEPAFDDLSRALWDRYPAPLPSLSSDAAFWGARDGKRPSLHSDAFEGARDRKRLVESIGRFGSRGREVLLRLFESEPDRGVCLSYAWLLGVPGNAPAYPPLLRFVRIIAGLEPASGWCVLGERVPLVLASPEGLDPYLWGAAEALLSVDRRRACADLLDIMEAEGGDRTGREEVLDRVLLGCSAPLP
ncbi:MAG TPA: hypothetical protein PK668_09235 [Myxococcota bacterium]|nr:hypothetical protein [Myxococcota bacterium]HRY92836.1 hypothetical protein [Myxococcota bacterium]HSA20281.1 hypothetical protein [Myxococcota bacterium]